MRIVLLLIMMIAAPLCPAEAQDAITIAAFGDSLVAGYGLPLEDAFPAQLQAKLQADGYKVNMLNDGVSGDTTSGGVARVDYVLAQKPSVVLIVLGGNDLLRGLPPAETRQNLNIILSRFHAAGMKVLLAGQKVPSITYGSKYAEAYNSIFCDLAKKYDAECYPFFLEGVYGNTELMQPDSIHPNKQGVEVSIGKLYPQVVKLLK